MLAVVKALHLVFAVAWFAGLFYMVRLFIYHTEANDREETERKVLQAQFLIMQKRLWYIIAWPAMILNLFFGLWRATPYFEGWSSEQIDPPWLIVKLSLVFGLVLYHLYCGRMFRQLQNGVLRWTSNQLRMWNEVATLFLVGIIFVAVFKDAMSAVWGVVGMVTVGVVLMIAIRLYKKRREKKANTL